MSADTRHFGKATVCYSDGDKGSLGLKQDEEEHLYTVVVENEGWTCFLSCMHFEVWVRDSDRF